MLKKNQIFPLYYYQKNLIVKSLKKEQQFRRKSNFKV